MGPFIAQRAVEAMLGSNTMVFGNEYLVARAKQLRLTEGEAKDDENDDKKEGNKTARSPSAEATVRRW